MDSEKNFFKELHKGDLRTLLNIYWENKPIFFSKYFWIASSCSITSTIISHIFSDSKLELIVFLAKQTISIFPGILGFNLGGYILLISLNSTSILNELTNPVEENGERYSFYQKMSSVFAFSILLQALSLIMGFAFLMIVEIGKSIYIPYNISEIVNFMALLFFSFVVFYAIMLICQIVLNVFNFGQVQHFFIRINNIENDQQ